MTEPSELAKKLACELALAQSCVAYKHGQNPAEHALALYIDKVDGVAREIAEDSTGEHTLSYSLARSLMLPDEPDVLEEVCLAMFPGEITGEVAAKRLRAELEKRGLTIAPKEPK